MEEAHCRRQGRAATVSIIGAGGRGRKHASFPLPAQNDSSVKRHWTYGWFFDADGTLKPNRELVRASSKENPFLPPEFYDLIASEYTPGSTLARQELEGEFVDLTGLMFQYLWFKLCGIDDVPQDAQRVRY